MGALKDEIVELIGESGLLSLSQWRGGGRLYVPKRYDRDHDLVGVLGPDHARALIDRLGGCRIAVPARRHEPSRADDICRMRKDGWSVAGIARRQGLSERQVWRVLSGKSLK